MDSAHGNGPAIELDSDVGKPSGMEDKCDNSSGSDTAIGMLLVSQTKVALTCEE